jgi:Putative Na+/H+ antiporter
VHDALIEFPRSLSSYPDAIGLPLLDVLRDRIAAEPFNAYATAIFALAVLHTFVAARFIEASHWIQAAHDARRFAAGWPPRPSIVADALHFLGEVEVVFGLWGIPLLAAIATTRSWTTAVGYVNDTLDYTEPMFVVVIMSLASTRPVVGLAESLLSRFARLGRCTPGAWWLTILTIGPMLGSLITEPAAMTISALLLARNFMELRPSLALRYATLGLLFVNVSIGGTLTHFAAPPVLMVAHEWGWDTSFMLNQFGWRALVSVLISTSLYYLYFRKQFSQLAARAAEPSEIEPTPPVLSAPAWVIACHVAFMFWSVVNAHSPALFVAGFLFFLGFARATAEYQTPLDIKTPLLVGFFLAGLKLHGTLQGWWIAPVLSSLSDSGLFWGATFLTAFNDNALITYLSTLVPNLALSAKMAVMAGAVTGGGLTVIANAPNPAGQSLLARYFDNSVHPLKLFAGAAIPTLIAAAMFLYR